MFSFIIKLKLYNIIQDLRRMDILIFHNNFSKAIGKKLISIFFLLTIYYIANLLI